MLSVTYALILVRSPSREPSPAQSRSLHPSLVTSQLLRERARNRPTSWLRNGRAQNHMGIASIRVSDQCADSPICSYTPKLDIWKFRAGLSRRCGLGKLCVIVAIHVFRQRVAEFHFLGSRAAGDAYLDSLCSPARSS
jgi:hypothetical protein